jgi:hypothetical protein
MHFKIKLPTHKAKCYIFNQCSSVHKFIAVLMVRRKVNIVLCTCHVRSILLLMFCSLDHCYVCCSLNNLIVCVSECFIYSLHRVSFK